MLIIGSPGSGKSFLARRLAAAAGLPAVHLDRHFWGEDWTEPTREVWLARLNCLLAVPRWIMDGNYTDTLALRLAAADTAIFLDFSGTLCLARVVWRSLRWWGRNRGDDMAPGCRERIDAAFLHYVWRFSRDQRPRVVSALDNFSGPVVVLRDNRDVAAFVGSLASRS